MVARILINKFPKFACLKSYLSEELPLHHENSTTASCQSEIITMLVLMKDEKKYSGCVNVLNELKERTQHIYMASGMCKAPPDQPSISLPLVEVPTWPDQPRSRIPPERSDLDPLQGVKMIGDELTRVRFAGAQDLRFGCHTAKPCLDHLYLVSWHTKGSFLKVRFKLSSVNIARMVVGII